MIWQCIVLTYLVSSSITNQRDAVAKKIAALMIPSPVTIDNAPA